MNEELLTQINEMDNFRLLRFFDHFGRNVVSAIDLDRDTLVGRMSESAMNSPKMSSLLGLPAEKARDALSHEDAMNVARSTLEAMALNPNIAPGLKQSLDSYSDEEMPASIILAIGFAASMIIIAATTSLRVSFKNGKIEGEIVKETASSEMVDSVMVPLGKAVNSVVS